MSFKITVETLARSLSNFKRTDTRIYYLWDASTSESGQFGNSQLSCVCPGIDNEFRHNIVKVAVDPRSDTIKGQTHEKLTSICQMEDCCELLIKNATNVLTSLLSFQTLFTKR